MKNRKHHINKVDEDPTDMFADPSSEEMVEDVIGTKMLYNWLYQEEEENYYSSAKVSDFSPDFAENEALFVQY
jgi:hypothetical protein